jgi:hypothetical protein
MFSFSNSNKNDDFCYQREEVYPFSMPSESRKVLGKVLQNCKKRDLNSEES